MTNLQRIRAFLSGLVTLACGVAVVYRPDVGIAIIVIIIVITTIVRGLQSQIYYATMARHMVGGKIQLYKGVILLDVGMFFITLDNIPRMYLVIYLLIAHLITGGIEILSATEAKRMESGTWRLNLASGLIIAISGVACIFCLGRPNILVYIYASGLFYSGGLRILSAFRRSAIVYIQ